MNREIPTGPNFFLQLLLLLPPPSLSQRPSPKATASRERAFLATVAEEGGGERDIEMNKDSSR